MNRDAVIIFAKNPVRGRVKTRLGAEIGEEVAANLYRAFLIDTLERCSALTVPLRLYLGPTDDPLDPALVEYDSQRLRQRGRDLGMRMHNALVETFDAGFERVVLIGSDHPTLPVDRILEALRTVSSPDTIAIGPSDDGGYYLLSMSRPQPALFSGMEYSHDGVFKETMARANAAGLHTVVLEHWYDVDTIDDVGRLSEDVLADAELFPNTCESLLRGGLIENTR